MAQAHVEKTIAAPKKESRASLERMADSKAVIIFFLVLICIALLAGAVYQHMAYVQVKKHDDTISSDNLNGQSPANTTGSTTGASTPAPSAAAPAANSSAPASGSPAARNNTPAANNNKPAANAAPAANSNTPAPAPSQSGTQGNSGAQR